jgi:hypothetical protein
MQLHLKCARTVKLIVAFLFDATSKELKFDNVADESNVVFKINGNTTLELLMDKMHICNFSLQIKTTDSIEEVKWERKFYAYTLLQIPSNAEKVIVKSLDGATVEFTITHHSNFPSNTL